LKKCNVVVVKHGYGYWKMHEETLRRWNRSKKGSRKVVYSSAEIAARCPDVIDEDFGNDFTQEIIKKRVEGGKS